MYPRECNDCHKRYNSAQTFSRHRILKRCERSVAKDKSESKIDSPHPTINTQNINIQNNVFINTAIGQDSLTPINDSNLSWKFDRKQQSHLEQLQKLLREEDITDVNALKSVMQKFQKTWAELIDRDFNRCHLSMEYVSKIHDVYDDLNLPLKENKDNDTVVDLPAREVLLVLCKDLWRKLFFPTVNLVSDLRSTCHVQNRIANLVTRPIRAKGLVCEIRNHDYSWMRQEWRDVVLPSFRAVHETLVMTLKMYKSSFSSTLIKAIDPFLQQIREVYIPSTIEKELIKLVIADSAHELVDAWHLLEKMFVESQDLLCIDEICSR